MHTWRIELNCKTRFRVPAFIKNCKVLETDIKSARFRFLAVLTVIIIVFWDITLAIWWKLTEFKEERAASILRVKDGNVGAHLSMLYSITSHRTLPFTYTSTVGLRKNSIRLVNILACYRFLLFLGTIILYLVTSIISFVFSPFSLFKK
jgi:hypothetical protein